MIVTRLVLAFRNFKQWLVAQFAFGLLNIPVQLMAGTRGTDLSFRMLDARDKSPIR